MNQTENNITTLYKMVKDENDHLKRQLAILQEQIQVYESMYGENYIPALQLKKIIEDAEIAKDKYLTARDSYEKMTVEYKQKMKETFGI